MKATEIAQYLHDVGINTITQESSQLGAWNTCRILTFGKYHIECFYSDRDIQIRILSQYSPHDTLVSIAPWVTDDFDALGIFCVSNLSRDQRFITFYFSQDNELESLVKNFIKILNKYTGFAKV